MILSLRLQYMAAVSGGCTAHKSFPLLKSGGISAFFPLRKGTDSCMMEKRKRSKEEMQA